MAELKACAEVHFSGYLQISNHCLRFAARNLQKRSKIQDLGLHWFRHGFGRVAGHVEALILVKQQKKN